jgi:hypothetical protein
MQPRATDDRRVKKHKIADNNRSTRRRQEDQDNIKAYYTVLGGSIILFIIMGAISFVWGR